MWKKPFGLQPSGQPGWRQHHQQHPQVGPGAAGRLGQAWKAGGWQEWAGAGDAGCGVALGARRGGAGRLAGLGWVPRRLPVLPFAVAALWVATAGSAASSAGALPNGQAAAGKRWLPDWDA